MAEPNIQPATVSTQQQGQKGEHTSSTPAPTAEAVKSSPREKSPSPLPAQTTPASNAEVSTKETLDYLLMLISYMIRINRTSQ